MKKRVYETAFLVMDTLKWSVLATIIGVLVGLSTSFFIRSLDFGINIVKKLPYYYFYLPLVFFVLTFIISKFLPNKNHIGTDKVIKSIHRESGKISPKSIVVNFLAPIITIAFGGSAGKEAPACDVGAGISSLFALVFRFDKKSRKKLVICGVSAGFAAAFGTPLAGAIFGLEVLYVGRMLYDVLLPSFVSSIVSFAVSSRLGINFFYKPMVFDFGLSHVFLLDIIVAGIFFGIVSIVFIELVDLTKKVSGRIHLWEPFKGLIGGMLIALLAFLLSEKYLGLGFDTIELVLEGQKATIIDSILKMIFTSFTLSFGGEGGIITPIFFVGSTSGAWLGRILHVNTSLFAALGLVSVLSGMTNTPVASSFLALELFGPDIGPCAAVSCIISFLVAGHKSIYPSQIVETKKLPTLESENEGKEKEKALR